MKGYFFYGLFLGPCLVAQNIKVDTLKTTELSAIEFTKRLPVTKEVIDVKKDLDLKNMGQDLPILLKNQTAVISTSDAGNGVGYTGFRIRGVAGTSINVMLNGVPYNDAESQGTFFVNVPDLTSSASQIMIQRGVGTSTNGVSSFGASVNILSKEPSESLYAQVDNSYGSFGTYKYAAEVGSGKFWKNRLSAMGRYSRIHSDGFIDRAESNLHSYNFTAMFEEGGTKIQFLTFGGKEKTYQAWNGIDRETWLQNPRFNYSGAIYDANWENIVDFYDNETDNYRQSNYQLLWKQRWSDRWNSETTFHYTRGKGYYENYKQDAKYSKYNLPNRWVNGVEILRSDFIRKKWLDNDFYGVVTTINGKFDNLTLNMGAVANQYYGWHFGNVDDVFYSDIKDFEYYRNRSVKNEISGFAKAILNFNRLELFGDLQLRSINYDTKVLQQGDDEGANLKKSWVFFNPKVGASYRIPNGRLYASYAIANREPNRDDLFANNETEHETLHDIEMGVERNFGLLKIAANVYYMYYVNQLVLTGELNNVGEFIRANSGKSYRKGIELNVEYPLSKKWLLSGNVAFSENKNLDYKEAGKQGTENLGKTPISFSPSTIANFQIQYRPLENFHIGVQNQYVGKQYLNNSGVVDFMLKDYFLTDVYMKYGLHFRTTKVDLKLQINNLFDKKYVNNGSVWDGVPYYFAQAGVNYMFGATFYIQ